MFGVRRISERRSHTVELVRRWATSVFTVGLLLVLAVSLFPYVFLIEEGVRRIGHDFPLLAWTVPSHLADGLANVFLYFPLGFGLTCLMQKKGVARQLRFPLLLIAGVGLSVILEFLQFFLPARVPSLLDVLSNGAGALIGFLGFQLGGGRILAYGSAIEAAMTRALSTKCLVASFLGYAAAVFLITIPLQRATSLGNWNKAFPLLVGNERTGDRPWRGRVYHLEIANRAVSEQAVESIFREGLSGLAHGAVIASFDFTSPREYEDRSGHLPGLSWRGASPSIGDDEGVILTGNSWLETGGPAARLIERVQETNQFTLFLACTTAAPAQSGPARIVSISADPTHRNLTLGQEGEALVVRLRTPVTGENGTEPELVVPGIFAGTGRRDFVLTYDGSKLVLYVGQLRHAHSLELSPGAAFFKHFVRLRAQAMTSYKLVYYGLVFAPVGVLLALIAKKRRKQPALMFLLFGGIVFLLSGLLEVMLVELSDRAMCRENVGWGILFSLGAAVFTYFGRR